MILTIIANIYWFSCEPQGHDGDLSIFFRKIQEVTISQCFYSIFLSNVASSDVTIFGHYDWRARQVILSHSDSFRKYLRNLSRRIPHQRRAGHVTTWTNHKLFLTEIHLLPLTFHSSIFVSRAVAVYEVVWSWSNQCAVMVFIRTFREFVLNAKAFGPLLLVIFDYYKNDFICIHVLNDEFTHSAKYKFKVLIIESF